MSVPICIEKTFYFRSNDIPLKNKLLVSHASSGQTLVVPADKTKTIMVFILLQFYSTYGLRVGIINHNLPFS